MITDPARLITRERVSHIPEGMKYFYRCGYEIYTPGSPWLAGMILADTIRIEEGDYLHIPLKISLE